MINTMTMEKNYDALICCYGTVIDRTSLNVFHIFQDLVQAEIVVKFIQIQSFSLVDVVILSYFSR